MRHRKFARLARLLGSEPLARGHLELLWDVAYENGDEVLGDAGDVEHLARWAGEPGFLARALVESGLVDLDGDFYRVHDLWDHAPDYVRKRRSREAERRTTGAKLRESADTDRTPTGHCPPNGETRAPAPAPAPAQEAAAAREETEPVRVKPLPVHLQGSCPLLSELLRLAAFGIDVGRSATTWGAAETLIAQVGPEPALALVAEAAPRSRGYPDSVPLSFVTRVLLDATKQRPNGVPKPNPRGMVSAAGHDHTAKPPF